MYQNYLSTLSPIQKKKWQEKQGALCYYELFDLLHEDFSLEEAGAILLGLIYYDKVGGSESLPEDIEKIITSDRAVKTVFKTYTEKTAASTNEWINRHKLKNLVSEEKEQNSVNILENEDIPF